MSPLYICAYNKLIIIYIIIYYSNNNKFDLPFANIDNLYKGEWTTSVHLNPLLTGSVSAYTFFRDLNCVLYYS